MTFSSAVRVGTRLKSWNTKPISRARILVRSRSPRVDHVATVERELGRGAVIEVRGMEQPEDVHERALAGPGRPHDRDHLAGVDGDVDAPERVRPVVPAELVCLAQGAAFEQGVDRSSIRSSWRSLVAKRRDRVEPGGVEGRDEAGERAEDRREGDGGDRRAGRELEQDRARRAAGLVDERDDDRSEDEPDGAADEAR